MPWARPAASLNSSGHPDLPHLLPPPPASLLPFSRLFFRSYTHGGTGVAASRACACRRAFPTPHTRTTLWGAPRRLLARRHPEAQGASLRGSQSCVLSRDPGRVSGKRSHVSVACLDARAPVTCPWCRTGPRSGLLPVLGRSSPLLLPHLPPLALLRPLLRLPRTPPSGLPASDLHLLRSSPRHVLPFLRRLVSVSRTVDVTLSVSKRLWCRADFSSLAPLPHFLPILPSRLQSGGACPWTEPSSDGPT